MASAAGAPYPWPGREVGRTPMLGMQLIRVDIIGLSTSPSSGGAYALVLGETGGSRRLPIIIGAFEAQAIALELEKIQPPRPMTHDLLRDAFLEMGGDVVDVVIDELREGTFFAKIRFVRDGRDCYLDARPSDAVALAVRVDADIFVTPAVLEEAGIPVEGDDSKDADEQPDSGSRMTRAERMERQLSKAIKEENYEEAARLRDALLQLREKRN